jgi:hypothetical protein
MRDKRGPVVILFVRSFRHHITGKRVYPTPPRQFFRLVIPLDKYLAYQKRLANRQLKKRNAA